MRTIHSIPVGRRRLVLRSDGNVYVMDPQPGPMGGEDSIAFDHSAKLVATSAAGCQAMAEAFAEMATKIREGGAP